MKKTLVAILLISHVTVSLCAQSKNTQTQTTLAITHVAVINTNGGAVKRDMTVIIAHGRIAAVGKSRAIRVPKDAEVINATGKFLIPGLWDMHVHLDSSDFGRNYYLRLLIVNGVTGIRLMDGDPTYHQWRREIERGLLLGPRMVIASQVIAGPASYASDTLKVNNAEEARAAVKKAKQERVDFIKVHDGLSRAAYFTIVEEAKKLKITIAGHVPEAIKAIEASNAGQHSIEHFTGLTEAETDAAQANLLSSVFKTNNTWLCPTLIMRRNYAVLDERFLAEDTRVRYASRSSRAYWSKVSSDAKNIPASDWAARRETVRREQALVGRFHKTGVGILAGTDTSNPYVMPGFGLHDELVMLVESGLAPMQALQAATLNPARFFNQTRSFGSVEKGRFADLVLLNANPLEDIRNTTKISAVVVQGRFLDRQELDRMLADIEAAAR